MTSTAGETLFEQYLGERAIEFDREPEIPGHTRRPDYRLKLEPVVYVEVKDFEWGPLDDAFAKGPAVGSRDLGESFRRIRQAIDQKSAQLRGVKGEACVVVLHNAGTFLSLDPFFVSAAMFGDPKVSVPIGGGDAHTIHTDGSTLQSGKNTTVSAVAILSTTEAHPELTAAALAPLLERQGKQMPTEGQVREFMELLDALYTAHPEAMLRLPSLTVHHNPYAIAPLPELVFQGRHDRQIRYEPQP